MNDLKTPFTKQYFKIRKLSDTELNERRSLTAMAIALQMEKNLAPWQQSFDPKKDIEYLSLINISEPTRVALRSYGVLLFKKK